MSKEELEKINDEIALIKARKQLEELQKPEPEPKPKTELENLKDSKALLDAQKELSAAQAESEMLSYNNLQKLLQVKATTQTETNDTAKDEVVYSRNLCNACLKKIAGDIVDSIQTILTEMNPPKVLFLAPIRDEILVIINNHFFLKQKLAEIDFALKNVNNKIKGNEVPAALISIAAGLNIVSGFIDLTSSIVKKFDITSKIYSQEITIENAVLLNLIAHHFKGRPDIIVCDPNIAYPNPKLDLIKQLYDIETKIKAAKETLQKLVNVKNPTQQGASTTAPTPGTPTPGTSTTAPTPGTPTPGTSTTAPTPGTPTSGASPAAQVTQETSENNTNLQTLLEIEKSFEALKTQIVGSLESISKYSWLSDVFNLNPSEDGLQSILVLSISDLKIFKQVVTARSLFTLNPPFNVDVGVSCSYRILQNGRLVAADTLYETLSEKIHAGDTKRTTNSIKHIENKIQYLAEERRRLMEERKLLEDKKQQPLPNPNIDT